MKSLASNIKEKMILLIKTQKHELKAYLDSVHEDIEIMRGNYQIKSAVKAFTKSWDELESNQTDKLQDL